MNDTVKALVAIRDGEVRTTSVDIAAAFEKAHKDVLRAVDNLIEQLPEEFERNFAPEHAQVPTNGRGTRTVRSYSVTRDGFSLLAMGFTGQRALEWKLKFLEAFKTMEAALRAQLSDNDNRPALAPRPLMFGSSEDLARVDVCLRMVREARLLFGTERAREVWGAVGLPVPREPEVRALPAPEARGEGALWAWAAHVGLTPDRKWSMSLDMLHRMYADWCARTGHDAAPIERFERGLKLGFGEPEIGALYLVRTTR